MEEARLRSPLLVSLLRAMPPKIRVHVECASFEARMIISTVVCLTGWTIDLYTMSEDDVYHSGFKCMWAWRWKARPITAQRL